MVDSVTERCVVIPVSLKIDDNWVLTPSTATEKWKKALNKCGVSRLRVGNSSAIGFSYFIEVTNSQEVTLIFTDSEGDVYSLRCVSRGDHTVRFNSDKPTIKEIRVEAFDAEAFKYAVELGFKTVGK